MAGKVTGVAFIALLALVSAGAAGPPAQHLGSLCSEFEALPAIPACGWVSTVGWNTYEDEEHGFAIQYPNDFVPVMPGNELVARGAVVTFLPTFDPSIDETGAQTNLYEVSVTIGRVRRAARPPQPESVCLIGEGELRLDGLRDIGGRTFSRYCFSDAGAGNRYEKVSYRTAWGGTCYEIALFVHYGNPDCYPEGAIVVFDPIRFLHLFDTMASTFLALPLGPAVRGGDP